MRRHPVRARGGALRRRPGRLCTRRLGLRRALRLAGARDLGGPAPAAPSLSAPRRRHPTAPRRRHPGRGFGARPHAAVGRRRLEGGDERGLLGGGEAPGGPRGAGAAIFQPCGPSWVIAPGDGANPGARGARDGGHVRRNPASGQQPDTLPGAAHYRIAGPPIAARPRVKRERCVERK